LLIIEGDVKQGLKAPWQNDRRGLSVTGKVWEKNAGNTPSLCCVYCFGAYSHAQFQNATVAKKLNSLFKRQASIDRVIKYSRCGNSYLKENVKL
jgi:hypothetical protein